MCFGSVKVLTDLIKLFVVDFIEIQSGAPGEPESLDFPDGPLMIAGFLDLFISLSIIYLGLKFYRVGNNPEYSKTYNLTLKTMIIVVSWFILLTLMYILVVYAFEVGLDDWINKKHQSLEDARNEHYKRQRYKIKEEERSRGYNDITVREDFMVMIFMTIT